MGRRFQTYAVRELYAKHDGICAYCRRKTILLIGGGKAHLMATADHVVPLSRGGEDDLENMVLACNDCNNHKASYLPDIWKEAITRFPEWWKSPGGGARLRRYLHAADTASSDTVETWPWLDELIRWNREHSEKDAADFFERAVTANNG